MCGIVGFNGNKNEKFNNGDIRILMLLNEPRGRDSFGFWTKEQGLQKQIGNISKKLETLDYKPSGSFIGHTRAKTVGSTSIENQHPFEYGQIVGCHNGTIKDLEKLSYMYSVPNENFNSDSQLIYQCLEKTLGINVFQDFKGAGAFLFTDTENKKRENLLYVVRNAERPLHYGFKKEGIYISSESDPLERIGCNDIKMFKTETVYTLLNGKIEEESTIEMKPVTAHNKYYGDDDPKKTNTQSRGFTSNRQDKVYSDNMYLIKENPITIPEFNVGDWILCTKDDWGSFSLFPKNSTKTNHKTFIHSKYIDLKNPFKIEKDKFMKCSTNIVEGGDKSNRKRICNRNDYVIIKEIVTEGRYDRITNLQVQCLKTSHTFNVLVTHLLPVIDSKEINRIKKVYGL